MEIVFLKAGVPLTKTYTKKADGSIEKTSYPNVSHFTSITETVADLKQFEVLAKKHAALGHTLLKGSISRPLVNESRKGSTDSNAQTDWIVFDVDGLPGATTVEQFLAWVGLFETSYVVQYSASYGIENMHLRAHVFMQLTKPIAATILKQWLMDLNHRVDILRNSMSLTRTGNALSWPLDITACQNDKLIYIAPPLLKGGLKDPMGKTLRIAYIHKRLPKLDLSQLVIPSAETNKERTHKMVNKLREDAGMAPRKHVYKTVGSNQVLSKPDSATISEMKKDRDFVYFNLNGGDSWGYYHPENNPDFIFNFKGEPTYLTKELLPEYWEQITSNSAPKTTSTGLMYLTMLDKRSSNYFRGTFDPSLDELDLYQAKTETILRHFAKQHGVPLGDFIPEWDVIFDPHYKGARVDPADRIVNLYEPTIYGKAKTKKVTIMPPTIKKLIYHALGGSPGVSDPAVDAIFNHFINWLACVFQFKTRTRTAWVLHGEEGTGKGALMNLVIRPLLGMKQTAFQHMNNLNETYNHWMENCFVAFIDEIEAKALENEKGVAARLRNWITEPTINIRKMHSGTYEADNFCNMIFASNKADPIVLTAGDRRYNVAKFQPVKYLPTEKEIDKIEQELQAFHDYMMTYAADRKLAGTLIATADRQTMISISETSVDVAVSRLLTGDMEFFVDQLPSDDSYKRDPRRAGKVEDYKEVLLHLIDRTDPATGKCNISRDELHVVFGYTIGNVPETPNKFTSMLKHHRVHTEKVWVLPRGAVQGIKTTWQIDAAKLAEFRDIIAPVVKATPQLKAVKGTKK